MFAAGLASLLAIVCAPVLASRGAASAAASEGLSRAAPAIVAVAAAGMIYALFPQLTGRTMSRKLAIPVFCALLSGGEAVALAGPSASIAAGWVLMAGGGALLLLDLARSLKHGERV